MTTHPTEFRYLNFSCAAEIFRNGRDVVVRFYDAAYDHPEKQIRDLVIADPGLGFLCLRLKGRAGLLTGFLDETMFANDEIVEAAITFTQSLSPESESAYIPHHIDRIRRTSYVEYNGEY